MFEGMVQVPENLSTKCESRLFCPQVEERKKEGRKDRRKEGKFKETLGDKKEM
jgi:hypothetical protein